MGKDKINIHNMTVISMFSALTVIGAFLSIPFSPVPISLQSLFVLLSGMVLGSKNGAISQLLYIFLGAIGLPVFSGFKGGLGILFGPTGGFLFGFVVSSYIVGKIIENYRKINILYYFITGLLGALIYYLIGIPQLSLITQIGIKESIMVGVMPFLIGDILKVLIASIIAVRIKFILELK
ncbi:MAG: biotin transporter BioY [Atribacterota bacterium]|nr:biotin transporter BioY [Atribacterota bacterium]